MAIYIKPTSVKLKDGSGNYHLFFLSGGEEHHLTIVPLSKPVLKGNPVEIEDDELQNKLRRVENIAAQLVGSFSEICIDFKDGTKCIIECKTINGLP
jgi:hypothetical protein